MIFGGSLSACCARQSRNPSTQSRTHAPLHNSKRRRHRPHRAPLYRHVQTLDQGRTKTLPARAKGSRPAAASRRHGLQFPFAVSRKRQAGPDVFFCQIREVRQNLLMRHARRQIPKHIRNRHPQPTNTPLPGLHRDDLRIIHRGKGSNHGSAVKENGSGGGAIPLRGDLRGCPRSLALGDRGIDTHATIKSE
jgi:hypothetical protein